MKNLAFVISLIFTLLASATSWSQATVYYASTEYGQDAEVEYKNVRHEKKSLILELNDGSQKTIDLTQEKVWGYRNSWGEDFRIRSAKESQRIIEYGPICVYSTSGVTATASPEFTPGWEDNPYRLNGTHTFSIQPDGKIIKFSRARFMKALRSDQKTYDKFRRLMDTHYNEMLIKIIEHNAELN